MLRKMTYPRTRVNRMSDWPRKSGPAKGWATQFKSLPHRPIGRFIPLNPQDGAELAFPGPVKMRPATGRLIPQADGPER
jgi:hypothetical protein